MTPGDGQRFRDGQMIFDTKLGQRAVFCRYTPDHPEYCATVRYGFSDEMGLLPFELRRFRLIGASASEAALPTRRGMGWQRQPEGDRFAPGDNVRHLDGGGWIRIHPGDPARGWRAFTVHEALGDYFTVRAPDPEPRARKTRRRAEPQGERRRFDMEM